jgi:hypothetical protein
MDIGKIQPVLEFKFTDCRVTNVKMQGASTSNTSQIS